MRRAESPQNKTSNVIFTVLFTPDLFDKETFLVSHLLAEPLINGLVTLVGTTISELFIWRKLKEVILRKGNKLSKIKIH